MPPDVLRLLDATLRVRRDAGHAGRNADADDALARALSAAGIDVIEVARSDAEPVAGVQALVAAVGNAEACVIAPATSDAVAKALELLRDAHRPRIHLYADVSPKGALAPALEAVFAARVNVDTVEFSPLRAFELPVDEVVEFAVAASDSGAGVLNLADARGDATAEHVRDLVARVVARLEGGATTSFQGDDRVGRAVENALAAGDAGARQIHVRLGGRASCPGDTNLEALVTAHDARGLTSDWAPRVDRRALPGLSALAAERGA
jgi:2-isopropylmalate synthase